MAFPALVALFDSKKKFRKMEYWIKKRIIFLIGTPSKTSQETIQFWKEGFALLFLVYIKI